MTTHTYLPEETMVRRAIEALMQALGPVETARFLSLAREQHPDSVEWHRHWQAELDPVRFLDEVFASTEPDH